MSTLCAVAHDAQLCQSEDGLQYSEFSIQTLLPSILCSKEWASRVALARVTAVIASTEMKTENGIDVDKVPIFFSLLVTFLSDCMPCRSHG